MFLLGNLNILLMCCYMQHYWTSVHPAGGGGPSLVTLWALFAFYFNYCWGLSICFLPSEDHNQIHFRNDHTCFYYLMPRGVIHDCSLFFLLQTSWPGPGCISDLLLLLFSIYLCTACDVQVRFSCDFLNLDWTLKRQCYPSGPQGSGLNCLRHLRHYVSQ